MEAFMFPNEIVDYHEYSIMQINKLFDLMKEAFENISDVSAYMCKQEINSIRTLKITEFPYTSVRLNYKPAPFIRIGGRWVEKAGFQVGDCIQVVTIKDMILIVPVRLPIDPYELEPE
jgi:hypothetical protein